MDYFLKVGNKYYGGMGVGNYIWDYDIQKAHPFPSRVRADEVRQRRGWGHAQIVTLEDEAKAKDTSGPLLEAVQALTTAVKDLTARLPSPTPAVVKKKTKKK